MWLAPLRIGLLMQRLGALASAHYVALTAVTGMGVALAPIVTGRGGESVREHR